MGQCFGQACRAGVDVLVAALDATGQIGLWSGDMMGSGAERWIGRSIQFTDPVADHCAQGAAEHAHDGCGLRAVHERVSDSRSVAGRMQDSARRNTTLSVVRYPARGTRCAAANPNADRADVVTRTWCHLSCAVRSMTRALTEVVPGRHPLQHIGGAQRGRRRVRGRDVQPLGHLHQECGQGLGQRHGCLADHGQVRGPVGERSGRSTSASYRGRSPTVARSSGYSAAPRDPHAHSARKASAGGRRYRPS